jgi:hypothetical protein
MVLAGIRVAQYLPVSSRQAMTRVGSRRGADPEVGVDAVQLVARVPSPRRSTPSQGTQMFPNMRRLTRPRASRPQDQIMSSSSRPRRLRAT